MSVGSSSQFWQESQLFFVAEGRQLIRSRGQEFQLAVLVDFGTWCVSYGQTGNTRLVH
jgi:hypothetical protein